MGIVALRVFIFSVLPLIIAATHVTLDKSTRSRERRLEIFLLYLFGVGVAGSGISSFFGHFFISDLVAESIDWPKGNPFQLEMAFANLTVGILGIVAMGRRDGFREATVVAVTVLGVGATVVHIMDMIQTGNLAPGNTLQNVSNLLKPALLVGFPTAIRRAERSPDSEAHTPAFEAWRSPRVRAAGLMTGSVVTGFGVGFGIDQSVTGTLLGTLVGAGLVVFVVSRPSDSNDERQRPSIIRASASPPLGRLRLHPGGALRHR
jgi:4-amino-4-deoxy-L-arabinose transferase-like glycosyltransferase